MNRVGYVFLGPDETAGVSSVSPFAPCAHGQPGSFYDDSAVMFFRNPVDAFEEALWKNAKPFERIRKSAMFKTQVNFPMSPTDSGWRVKRSKIGGMNQLSPGSYCKDLMSSGVTELVRWASHLPGLPGEETKRLASLQKRVEIPEDSQWALRPREQQKKSIRRLAETILLVFSPIQANLLPIKDRQDSLFEKDGVTPEEINDLFEQENREYKSVATEKKETLRELALSVYPQVAKSSTKIAQLGRVLVSHILTDNFRIAQALSERINRGFALSEAKVQGWLLNWDNPHRLYVGSHVKVRADIKKTAPDFPFNSKELLAVEEVNDCAGELLVSSESGPLRESWIPIKTVERVRFLQNGLEIDEIDRNYYLDLGGGD